MPTASEMSAVWPGMTRGVELYLSDELTADEAIVFIQNKIEQELHKIKKLEKVNY